MSKPILMHPDHLVDQARRGALTPEQWQDLGAHLAACPGCAWEHAAADDFAREQAAGGDLDPERVDQLVGGALARAGLSAEVAPPPATVSASVTHASAPSRARLLGRWFAAAMVAAALVAALALPTRGDPAPAVAPSDANLDAGSLGSPSASDS